MNEINRRKKETNYLKLISEIIGRDLRNKDISEHITVVDAKLSGDGSKLKIFVSFINREEKLFNELERAKGFIRSMLSQYEVGRKVPELFFEIDLVSKKAQKIDQILKEIKE
ncbi:MAG: 30S ribosome-binding factor RbfA [Metamycoplasmataceae bacterium]